MFQLSSATTMLLSCARALSRLRQVKNGRLAAGRQDACLTTVRGRDRPIEYDDHSHKMGDVMTWIRKQVRNGCSAEESAEEPKTEL